MADTFLEELADYLVTQGAVTAKGTDVYYDFFPDVTADPAVCLYDNGGQGKRHNPVGDHSVGVRVRASDYEAAEQKAALVYAAFHQKVDVTLETNRILWALADSLPESIGRDPASRSLVVFNVTIGAVE